MEWSFWIQSLFPVGVASIPLLILAAQIRQQNRLERKKIEVEYLRQALEALQTLLPMLRTIEDVADGLVLKRHAGELSQLELIHETRKMARDWTQTLHEFDSKLLIALAYAAEQKLHDFQGALQYAFNAGHKLEQHVADAMKRSLEGPPTFAADVTYAKDGAVSEFIRAEVVTSGSIVRRIKELYD